eukprot:g420.t1
MAPCTTLSLCLFVLLVAGGAVEAEVGADGSAAAAAPAAPAAGAGDKALFSIPITLGEKTLELEVREGDDRVALANSFCSEHWDDLKASGATMEGCMDLLAGYMSKIQNKLDAVLGGEVEGAAAVAAPTPAQRPLLTIDVTVDDRQLQLKYFEVVITMLPVMESNVDVLHQELLRQIPPVLAKVERCRKGCASANFYCDIICKKWEAAAEGGSALLAGCTDGCAKVGAKACHTGCGHEEAAACKDEVAGAAFASSGAACGGHAAEAAAGAKFSPRSACLIGSKAAAMSGCKRGISIAAKKPPPAAVA